MTPDPEKVREIARQYLADRISGPSDVGAYVMGHLGPLGDDLTKHEFGAWCSAVRADLLAAVPSWPDEQPQDEGDACGVQLPRESATRLGASPDTTCIRPAGHAAHSDGDGTLWISRPLGEQPQDEGDGVSLLPNPCARVVATVICNGTLSPHERAALRQVVDEHDAAVEQLVEWQAERDADVRAVAELLQAAKRIGEYGLVMDEETVAELVAWLVRAAGDVRARFADHIAELRAREGGEEA